MRNTVSPLDEMYNTGLTRAASEYFLNHFRNMCVFDKEIFVDSVNLSFIGDTVN